MEIRIDSLASDLLPVIFQHWINFSDYHDMSLLEASIVRSDTERICNALRICLLDACPPYRRSAVFETICYREAVLQAEWLLTCRKDFITPSKAFCCFLQVCKRGKLVIAKWLNKHFAWTLGEREQLLISAAFEAACVNGHEAVVKWLARRFDLSITPRIQTTVLQSLSANGHLRLCRYLVKKLQWHVLFDHVNNNDHVSYQMFRRACLHGHLQLAKWILKHCHVSSEQILRDASFLERIITEGKLSVLQWLAAQFDILTRFRKETQKMRLFALACTHGSLSVVKWLAQHWTVTRIKNHLLIKACSNRRQDIAKWLIQSLFLDSSGTGRECHSVLKTILYAACERGCCDVAKFTARQLGSFGRNKNEDKKIEAAFIRACRSNSLQTVNWMVRYFHRYFYSCPDSTGSLQSQITMAKGFKAALIAGHVDLAKWLYRGFQFDKERLVKWSSILKDITSPNILRSLFTDYSGLDTVISETSMVKSKAGVFLLQAYRHQDLNLVKWLTDKFNLTLAVKRRANLILICKCLLHACQKGQIDSAEWILDHHVLSLPNSSFIPTLLQEAVSAEEWSIVHWLATRFKSELCFDDSDEKRYAVLRCVCSCDTRGNQFMRDWLMDHFSLDRNKLRMYIDEVFLEDVRNEYR